TLLHLTLARRDLLRIYGGVRFGGTLTVDDAWEWGFHHIAMAAGAGRPTIIDMKNNLACGIRKASDFLMALQLTGAFKRTALPNLQVRLPALVIGGGLTAIDTATELIAYYPLQVEKVLARYEATVARWGEGHVRAGFDEEEQLILDEALSHGRAVRAERERARAMMVAAGTRPNAGYEKEFPGTFRVSEEGEFLQGFREVIDGEGRVRLLRAGAAEDAEAFFTSYEKNGHYVTYYGDNHPAYAG